MALPKATFTQLSDVCSSLSVQAFLKQAYILLKYPSGLFFSEHILVNITPQHLFSNL